MNPPLPPPSAPLSVFCPWRPFSRQLNLSQVLQLGIDKERLGLAT